MPKRNSQRDAAKAEYVKRRQAGKKVNLKELAAEVGVPYGTIRNWKRIDDWEAGISRNRGGQPGNQNSKGHKNAKGNPGGGAPNRNKNAEKDGAYSTVLFDRLSDEEKSLLEQMPDGAMENLKMELSILRIRQKRIMEKLEEYESAGDDELFTATVMDMRKPGKGPDGKKADSAAQYMAMINKDSAFTRRQALQEALYKISGRILTLAGQLRQREEFEKRYELEVRRLEVAEQRAIGEVDVNVEGDDDDEAIYGEGGSEMA